LSVPAATDAEKVKASFKSGILQIRLSKPTLSGALDRGLGRRTSTLGPGLDVWLLGLTLVFVA
jgi:hypothetical protein